MGVIINRHHIWKVDTETNTASIMVKEPKEVKGRTIYQTVVKKFDRLPGKDGRLNQHLHRRGKKNTFFIKTPKVERDFITWQLREHIMLYIHKTSNTQLLQKIYREVLDNANQEQQQRKAQKAIQAEIEERAITANKQNELSTTSVATESNNQKPTPRSERKSAPITKKDNNE